MTESDIRRVLLTGDVHGNTGWVLTHVFPQAKRQRCDSILQIGDFGIWPGPDGKRFLDALDHRGEAQGIPIWFIDGNHDDFAQLYALPLDAAGRRAVRPHITHLPRGHRWSWAGRTLLACGGASSVDVMYRTPWRSWWPQEVITSAELDACIEPGRADVLFSHDINLDVRLPGAFDLDDMPLEVRNAVYANRLALERIVYAVRPTLQVHGHWHFPSDQRFHRENEEQVVRVVSLSCDSGAGYHANGHCAVLDLEILAEDVIASVSVID
jgi:hypothetical protein